MRFRPEQHLRRQSDIRGVREHGQRVECRAFTLWWRKREPVPAAAAPLAKQTPPPLEQPRVCVIASTAAVGAATERNRAKRRLREIFRHHQQRVPADCDLLLIARGAVLNWPYVELEKRFSEACGKIPARTRSQPK
jgi:ribonuclease P protein component